jgi:hypothetical protein
MSVVLIAHWRAARQASNLAEALSSDLQVRAAARVRAMAEVTRREQRARNPVPAPVVLLDVARGRRGQARQRKERR